SSGKGFASCASLTVTSLVQTAQMCRTLRGRARAARTIALAGWVFEAAFLAGQGDPGRHVAQLLEGDLPGAGAQPAVGGDVDPRRIAEDVDGIEHPVADQLGRFD